MLRAKSAFVISLALVGALTLASISLPARAQVNPVNVAEGYELNQFANPNNVAEFATGSNAGPVAMAFDARGRLFVGTLSGRIFILLDNNDDGIVDQVKLFASGIPQPLGLEFRANGDLYMTSNVYGGAGSIIRLRDTNGDDVADEKTVILDNLPSAGDHQTDRLKFGPDGLLYIGQGSATDAGTPKEGRPDEGPLNATILRINVDVANPAVEVFATGLRNPFGMAFHPDNGELFATDGGSGEICQAPACVGLPDNAPPEEVNWVVQGGNYGFPLCEGTPTADNPGCANVRAPAIQYPRHLTPTALVFYTGPQAGEFKNQLLLTLYKNLPNTNNYGGDLRRLVLEGDRASGFRLRDDGYIAQLEPIDPFDGPVEAAINPISGDIYVARLDPVTHRILTEHHHIIYRIHRMGSDAQTFIGPARPSSVKAGSSGVTISITGRHLQAGAVVFNVTDNTPLVTRQGVDRFEMLADLPASALTTERTITLAARNSDGSLSNSQTFAVTKGTPDPPPDKVPHLASMFVYKKKRSKVVDTLFVGATAKKLRLVVDGTDFDAGAQLLINNVAVELDSVTTTELIGRFTSAMLAAPGELTVQVRNATGKLSNTLKLTVVP